MSRLDELVRMRDFLDREIDREMAHPTAGRLIRVAAKAYGVDVADVLGHSRAHRIVQARHAAAWLMRQSGMSYPDIGRTLGRDHTTIIHAVESIEASPRRLGQARALLPGLEVAS